MLQQIKRQTVCICFMKYDYPEEVEEESVEAWGK